MRIFLWPWLVWSVIAADLEVEPGALGSGKAYTRCSFDGVEQMCFVDSGSAMSLLAGNGLARRPSAGKFRYKSASGKVHEAEIVRIGTVSLDGKITHDIRIGRLTKPGSESTLGMDLLGKRPFSMVFRTAPKLQVEPQRRRDNGLHELKVLKSGLMAVPVGFGGAGTLAVWDTGASVTAVDVSFVRANPGNFKRLAQNVEGVDGTGEKVNLELFRAKELQVGGKRFGNIHVVVLDLGALRESVGTAVQSVLGFNAIRKADWYFDRSGKRWSVK